MSIAIVYTAMAFLLAAVNPFGISDVTFQRIEQTTGFDIFKSNLRVTKFNRTTAVVNGTVDIRIDLDNSFTIQGKAAYSRLGNTQFIEYPMKLAEQRVCDYMNTTYREFQEIYKNKTNYPQFGPEGLCPVPAGHYWYKHVTWDTKYFPPFIPAGYWRMTLLVTGTQGTAKVQLFMTVAKELY